MSLPSRLCCENCFADPELQKALRKHGTPGTCSYCLAPHHKCAHPSVIGSMLETLAGTFEFVEGGMHEFGEPLIERLQDQWGLFSSLDPSSNADIFSESQGGPTKDGDFPIDPFNHVIDPYEFYEALENHDQDLKDAWGNFCDEIRHRNRFMFDAQIEGLAELLRGCSTTVGAIQKTFYRARIVKKGLRFSIKEIGPPPADKARAGRGNPEGIPYFYLSETPATALREVRPKRGNRVWIAKFEATSVMKIVDLRTGALRSPFRYKLEVLKKMLSKRFLLRHLSTELSKPINPKLAAIHYLPTQYLCELIKNQGYKGIRFKSSLTQKGNLIAFKDTDFKYVSHQDRIF